MSSHASDEDDLECPLCLEELDLSDRKFKPCPCGYQICRFCWHHIKEQSSGTCPACRRRYSDQPAEFEPVDPAEVARMQKEKKQKEREKREMENANRRHLANMRVVQKNLVYVVGLPPKLAHEETLRQHEYFGQYGRIAKVVISRRTNGNNVAPQQQPINNGSVTGDPGVYITFYKKEDAARCIQAVEGTIYEGRVLKATYGTTKYCTFYLRGLTCQSTQCMYLHEPGEDADSYTREEMVTGKHQAIEKDVKPASSASAAASSALLPSQPLASQIVGANQHLNNANGARHKAEDSPSIQATKNAWKPIPQASAVSLSAEEWPTTGLGSSALPASAGWAKARTQQEDGADESPLRTISPAPPIAPSSDPSLGASSSSSSSSAHANAPLTSSMLNNMPFLSHTLPSKQAQGSGRSNSPITSTASSPSSTFPQLSSPSTVAAAANAHQKAQQTAAENSHLRHVQGATSSSASAADSRASQKPVFDPFALYQSIPCFRDILPPQKKVKTTSVNTQSSTWAIPTDKKGSVYIARGFMYPLALLDALSTKTDLPYNLAATSLFLPSVSAKQTSGHRPRSQSLRSSGATSPISLATSNNQNDGDAALAAIGLGISQQSLR